MFLKPIPVYYADSIGATPLVWQSSTTGIDNYPEEGEVVCPAILRDDNWWNVQTGCTEGLCDEGYWERREPSYVSGCGGVAQGSSLRRLNL